MGIFTTFSLLGIFLMVLVEVSTILIVGITVYCIVVFIDRVINFLKKV